jgi:hypothetical protein
MVITPALGLLAFVCFVLGAGFPARVARGLGLSSLWVGAASASADIAFAGLFLARWFAPAAARWITGDFLVSLLWLEVLLILTMPALGLVAVSSLGRSRKAAAGLLVTAATAPLFWQVSSGLGDAWPLVVYASLTVARVLALWLDSASRCGEAGVEMLNRWYAMMIAFPAFLLLADTLPRPRGMDGSESVPLPFMPVDRSVALDEVVLAFGALYFGAMAAHEISACIRKRLDTPSPDSVRATCRIAGYVGLLFYVIPCLAGPLLAARNSLTPLDLYNALTIAILAVLAERAVVTVSEALTVSRHPFVEILDGAAENAKGLLTLTGHVWRRLMPAADLPAASLVALLLGLGIAGVTGVMKEFADGGARERPSTQSPSAPAAPRENAAFQPKAGPAPDTRETKPGIPLPIAESHDFVLSRLDGKTVRFSEYAIGRVTILSIWDGRRVPQVAAKYRLEREFLGHPAVRVLDVVSGDASPRLLAWLLESDRKTRVLLDPASKVARQYRARSYTLFVVSPGGHIYYRGDGKAAASVVHFLINQPR